METFTHQRWVPGFRWVKPGLLKPRSKPMGPSAMAPVLCLMRARDHAQRRFARDGVSRNQMEQTKRNMLSREFAGVNRSLGFSASINVSHEADTRHLAAPQSP